MKIKVLWTNSMYRQGIEITATGSYNDGGGEGGLCPSFTAILRFELRSVAFVA
jgi:hypothetical protein